MHPGCTNCYAEREQAVVMRKGGPVKWGEAWQGGDRVVVADSTWQNLFTWARAAAKAGHRRKVFCASLADVLEVPADPHRSLGQPAYSEAMHRTMAMRHTLDAARARLWEVIRQTAAVGNPLRQPVGSIADFPGLDWLLLTKRPENWRLVPEDVRPLVWLGTSISDQATADEWVPRLLKAEGFRYRFLSVEPMVGPVDLSRWIGRIDHCNACGAEHPPQGPDRCPECGRTGTLISTWGTEEAERYRTGERYTTAAGQRDVDGQGMAFDWVICGAESGSKARGFELAWARALLRQCAEAGVPAFMKQVGPRPYEKVPMLGGGHEGKDLLAEMDAAGKRPWDGWTVVVTKDERFKVRHLKVSDPKGGNPEEWPTELRVRQWPGVSHG